LLVLGVLEPHEQTRTRRVGIVFRVHHGRKYKPRTDTTNLQNGVLFKHVGAAGVYRCPADKSTVKSKPGLPRTRSYSMNWWLNGDYNGLNASTTPEDKTKTTQLLNPTQIFVFSDEHERSINDGTMIVTSDKYLPSHQWGDLPADRHNQGCNLSFADGHVERWKWKCPKRYKSISQTAENAQDHDDLYRMKAASIPDIGR